MKSKLNTPNNEQLAIIKNIENRYSVIVQASAGCGKSTTVLNIANKFKNYKILQVTYNRHLKDEVCEKRDNLKLYNLEIQTYSGLFVKYYNHDSCRSIDIDDILNNNSLPINTMKLYDLIIIDEAQDMNIRYYRLMHKFIRDMYKEYPYNNNIQIMIMGDDKQAIYEFGEDPSDRRFLSKVSSLWPSFTNIKSNLLIETFRCTKQISSFVNDILFGGLRKLVSYKDGPKIRYLKKNGFSVHKELATMIQGFLSGKNPSNKKYKNDDIFVLAYSTNHDKRVNLLENELAERNIKCHVTKDNIDYESKGDILKNKIVFTSMHKSKGRERAICIVIGLDDNFYFMDKENKRNRSECPNELYVACSRALEYLIILDDSRYGKLPSIKHTYKELSELDYIHFSTDDLSILENNNSNIVDMDRIKIRTSPTSLTERIDTRALRALSSIMPECFIGCTHPNAKSIDLPYNIYIDDNNNKMSYEIADINGVCIPTIYEHKTTNESTIYKRLEKELIQETNQRDESYYTEMLRSVSILDNKISSYLHMSSVYISYNSQLLTRYKSIKLYDWLTDDIVNICIDNMKLYIPMLCEYEKHISKYEKNNDGTLSKKLLIPIFNGGKYGIFEINGYIDAVTKDQKIIYEFKCVEKLKIEHFLQICIYKWMWYNIYNQIPSFVLLNIRTGECYECIADIETCEYIISILIENKYYTNPGISDEEFISLCKQYI